MRENALEPGACAELGTCSELSAGKSTRQEAQGRRFGYLFLSRMLLEEASLGFLKELAEHPPAVGGELEAFAAGLAGADLERVRTDAAAEFAALLLNMSADPVFPYESVYTSDERLMMQQARDEVLALYRREGFVRADEVNVPEDHAGIELEFMARLCQREADALEACDAAGVGATRRVQEEFLRAHLVRWMPEFCDDLEKRAKSGLYRGVAQTLRQLLEVEAEDFEIGLPCRGE